jgi:hypothetical protein
LPVVTSGEGRADGAQSDRGDDKAIKQKETRLDSKEELLLLSLIFECRIISMIVGARQFSSIRDRGVVAVERESK